MSEREGSTHWWQTIPGILTGLAALLTAAGGLLVTFHQTGIFTIFETDEVKVPPVQPELPEISLIKEVMIEVSRYPSVDFPYKTTIEVERNQRIAAIGILTDWWRKRPTEIQVYEFVNGEKGNLIGNGQFSEYLEAICGNQFDRQCKYPDVQGSATAELKVNVTSSPRLGSAA